MILSDLNKAMDQINLIIDKSLNIQEKLIRKQIVSYDEFLHEFNSLIPINQ